MEDDADVCVLWLEELVANIAANTKGDDTGEPLCRLCGRAVVDHPRKPTVYNDLDQRKLQRMAEVDRPWEQKMRVSAETRASVIRGADTARKRKELEVDALEGIASRTLSGMISPQTAMLVWALTSYADEDDRLYALHNLGTLSEEGQLREHQMAVIRSSETLRVKLKESQGRLIDAPFPLLPWTGKEKGREALTATMGLTVKGGETFRYGTLRPVMGGEPFLPVVTNPGTDLPAVDAAPIQAHFIEQGQQMSTALEAMKGALDANHQHWLQEHERQRVALEQLQQQQQQLQPQHLHQPQPQYYRNHYPHDQPRYVAPPPRQPYYRPEHTACYPRAGPYPGRRPGPYQHGVRGGDSSWSYGEQTEWGFHGEEPKPSCGDGKGGEAEAVEESQKQWKRSKKTT